MIADVVFDLPLAHAFSYAVPDGLSLEPGQRVRAPLAGRMRVGMVIATRYDTGATLKEIERAVESAPILSAAAIEVGRWAAEQSLSPLGATLLSLVPPAPSRSGPVAPPAPVRTGSPASRPELWMDADRHERLVDELAREGTALVIAPDREAVARWAPRLDAARLDSGASAGARRGAWLAAARGRARIVVGSRSALLAPLPPPATLVLLDERDPAHKPPGAPRMHSREILLRRAALDGSRLLLLDGAPSVESWWRADRGAVARADPKPGPWPALIAADTRGILRNHPLTLPLTRAIDDATRAGRRVALIVTRRAPVLLCGECGHVVRCPDCGVALAAPRGARVLRCALCARSEPAPERCPGCGGRRLAPLGWDAERVEASVRRRFPKLAISRTDPRAAVIIGAPRLLRSLPPASLGAVGLVAIDGLLGAPEFRGAERAFALLWAAAEATRDSGRVIAQTLHAEHYAVTAARAQAREAFYARELAFRAELGYPPFRRLCVVSARGKSEGETRARIGDCASAVRGVADLTVYPPAPRAAGAARTTRWQFVVKGPDDLPQRLSGPLAPFLATRRRGGAVIEVEMDPV